MRREKRLPSVDAAARSQNFPNFRARILAPTPLFAGLSRRARVSCAPPTSSPTPTSRPSWRRATRVPRKARQAATRAARMGDDVPQSARADCSARARPSSTRGCVDCRASSTSHRSRHARPTSPRSQRRVALLERGLVRCAELHEAAPGGALGDAKTARSERSTCSSMIFEGRSFPTSETERRDGATNASARSTPNSRNRRGRRCARRGSRPCPCGRTSSRRTRRASGGERAYTREKAEATSRARAPAGAHGAAIVLNLRFAIERDALAQPPGRR